jgi:glycosyltransferase involved in cell wall biosynthesis
LYEGFGFSPVEALRSKTPAILHKNPVYEELFGDVGIMVDGTNPEKVGKKIHEVYSNPEKFESRVEQGYNRSKKYTWESVASRTKEVFEKVSS